MQSLCVFLAIFLWISTEFCHSSQKPHIILIVADDLGWNDVGWHNRDMLTPNLDHLANNGVILNQSYVQPICSPSRSALMTGFYPYHIGTQNRVFMKMTPAGLPKRFKLLPEKLKDLGYNTHLVGKWHLGFCNWSYTPTYRGFDSFLGYYGGDEEYFTHMSKDFIEGTHANGIDFRFNKKALLSHNGTYSTYVFADRVKEILKTSSPNEPLFLELAFQSVHSPLEVPKKYENMYKNVKNRDRRIFSGMVTALDEAIGKVVDALKHHNFYDNSVIIFTTDNGGQVKSGGNNWPLRGNKFTIWEGGTRGVAFVHSKLIKKNNRVHTGLVHVVDWTPTILHLAGGTAEKVDGVNQWSAISNDEPSPRSSFVYNIYYNRNFSPSAIRLGKYKYIRGFPGTPSGWIPVPKSQVSNVSNNLTKSDNENVYLFDIEADPTERVNLARENPVLTKMMDNKLKELSASSVPDLIHTPDKHGDPSYWNNIWSPGWCTYR